MNTTSPDEIALTLWKVCPPIILLLGTFGNSMILILLSVFPQGSVSRSMGVFFAALAASDLVLLCSGLLRRWVQFMWHIDIRAIHDVICKLDVYLVYVSGMTSAWFLVAMTIQRVVSVVWPFQVGLMCTRGKTLVAVAVTMVLVALINVHLLVAYTISTINNTTTCTLVQGNAKLQNYDSNIFSWIDLILTSALPSCLLIISNSLMCHTVVQSARVARALVRTTSDSDANREKAASALTVTLMCVSVTYLVLTFPLPMYQFIRHVLDPEWSDLYVAVTNLTWYLNSAINFYIYCLTGTKFREQFGHLVCRWGVCPEREPDSRHCSMPGDYDSRSTSRITLQPISSLDIS